MPIPRTARPLRPAPRPWWHRVRDWLAARRHATDPEPASHHTTAVEGGEHPVTRRAHEATAALIRQGWNLHQPPYGYLTMTVSGSRSASGRPRTRLTPDPRRAPVVQNIFYWRAVTGLDIEQITVRLNNNPDCYPPPGSSWQPDTVAGVLTNLKYTGYQTFNTHDEDGRFRPADEWVLSAQPAHRALVTTALFWAAQNPTTDTRRALRHRLLAQPRHLAS
ncbi:recombinase family protein [Amycolatopsis sp. NPDC059657]|uniref:recombinase family protein n=1 Tax=Amycolatopsis sp. NPDC059657 TaxID=3346899 RepID=UPI00366ADFE2